MIKPSVVPARRRADNAADNGAVVGAALRGALRGALCGALGGALCLTACARQPPPSFPFTSAYGYDGRVYARSRAAAAGTMDLDGGGKGARLEYVFQPPLAVPVDASLAVVYSAGGSGAAGGQIVLEAGGTAWELPRDLLFLGSVAMPTAPAGRDGPGGGQSVQKITYAVPVPEGDLRGITVSWTPAAAAAGPARAFQIHGLGLTRRWYGFDAAAGAATPFVYPRDAALEINPPVNFRGRDAEIAAATAAAGNILVECGDGSVIEIDGDRIHVPSAFVADAAYPLRLTAVPPLAAVRLAAAPVPPAPSTAPAPPVPLTADPGLILAWPRDAWRDRRYEAFRWEDFPTVLILDMADYDTQDRFLKRLAFFVEKKGFRGRLAPDAEIAGLHGWNAHDYSAASLARFFEAARAQAFALSPEERELEDLFLAEGLITRGAGGAIGAGDGAVISISRQSPGYLRRRFMVHEGFHGIFFIDPAFRAFARSRWNAFSRVGRRFLLSYFDFMAYDTADEDLMVNEFMAYLLQEPVSQAAAYFGETLPGQMLAVSPWREDALPTESEATPDGARRWPALERIFADEARAFSDYAAHRWGLAAGRVWKATVR